MASSVVNQCCKICIQTVWLLNFLRGQRSLDRFKNICRVLSGSVYCGVRVSFPLPSDKLILDTNSILWGSCFTMNAVNELGNYSLLSIVCRYDVKLLTVKCIAQH